MSRTVFQNLNSIMNLTPDSEKKCTHSDLAYIEVVKHTIINTHHPITNSRVQAINDLEMGRVKEIKVPAYKCLDCGEIIDIKQQEVASSATTHNYGACAVSSGTMALGYASCSTGNTNIAIGTSAGCAFTYGADYSKNYNNRTITDMSFLDDMSEALKNAESRQEKAMENFANKQAKLDRIAEKVRDLRRGFSSDGNSLTSEIDKIKSEYDQIVNRQQYAQEQAQQQFSNNDFLTGSIREAASVISKVGATFIPAPPQFPQGRNVGVYDPSSDKGYYKQKHQPKIIEFTNIEFLEFMFTGIKTVSMPFS